MTDAQYYTIIAVPLVGILMNGVLFVYLGSRIDKVIEHMNDIRERGGCARTESQRCCLMAAPVFPLIRIHSWRSRMRISSGSRNNCSGWKPAFWPRFTSGPRRCRCGSEAIRAALRALDVGTETYRRRREVLRNKPFQRSHIPFPSGPPENQTFD